jgi:hypothetical protein
MIDVGSLTHCHKYFLISISLYQMQFNNFLLNGTSTTALLHKFCARKTLSVNYGPIMLLFLLLFLFIFTKNCINLFILCQFANSVSWRNIILILETGKTSFCTTAA